MARKHGATMTSLLAKLGVHASADIHSAYQFLEEAHLDGRSVSIATFPTTHYELKWPKLLSNRFVLVLNHFALVPQIVAALCAGRRVIIREFSNSVFLVLAPVFWPWRRRLLLNMNHNLSDANGRLGRMCLQALSNMRFSFLLLDGEEARTRIQAAIGRIKVLTPCFAIPDLRRKALPQPERQDDGRFLVGLVGDSRAEKGGLAMLVRAIRELLGIPGVAVCLGFRNPGQLNALPADILAAIKPMSTQRRDDYSNFFYACDAIVILASRDGYYLRHSGILMDALSRGIPAISPNFPVLSAQVSKPVRVGVCYAEIDKIGAAVVHVQQNLDSIRQNFDLYLRQRSKQAALAQLASQWMKDS